MKTKLIILALLVVISSCSYIQQKATGFMVTSNEIGQKLILYQSVNRSYDAIFPQSFYYRPSDYSLRLKETSLGGYKLMLKSFFDEQQLASGSIIRFHVMNKVKIDNNLLEDEPVQYSNDSMVYTIAALLISPEGMIKAYAYGKYVERIDCLYAAYANNLNDTNVFNFCTLKNINNSIAKAKESLKTNDGLGIETWQEI